MRRCRGLRPDRQGVIRRIQYGRDAIFTQDARGAGGMGGPWWRTRSPVRQVRFSSPLATTPSMHAPLEGGGVYIGKGQDIVFILQRCTSVLFLREFVYIGMRNQQQTGENSKEHRGDRTFS